MEFRFLEVITKYYNVAPITDRKSNALNFHVYFIRILFMKMTFIWNSSHP